MSPSTTMTIRLEPELKSRLDKLSAATHRSKSFLAAEAVREFVELNGWQIEEIKGTHMDPSFFAKKKSKYTNWRLKKNLDIGDRIQGQGSTT